MKATTTKKKPAAASAATSASRHVLCAQCALRRTRCECHKAPPPLGKLQSTHFAAYVAFLNAGAGGRRFLSECLDVLLLVQWLWAMAAQGAASMLLFLGVVSFRHFNRVRTWAEVVTCLDPERNAPDWKKMEANFQSIKGLSKPFSRPSQVLDADGCRIGDDITQNAMFFFQGLHASQHARAAASMLQRGVQTPEQFDELELLMDSLQGEFPGALGTYRRKVQYDLWVEASALSKHALRSYPVATGSGTYEGLKLLYGIPAKRTVSEPILRKLLVHLFHQVKKTDAFSAKNDSLATMSLTLCGWHRSRKHVRYHGTRMSVLSRALEVEEQEYLDIRHSLRELNVPWEIDYNSAA